MAQFRYDVVAQADGYIIVIAPDAGPAFAVRQDAIDAAIDLTRKLRFVGISLDVRADANRKERQRWAGGAVPPG
jgi:hypothetical protein